MFKNRTAQNMLLLHFERLVLKWLVLRLPNDIETTYLRLYSPLLGLGHFFIFLIIYTVGRIPWTGD
jgi:hypothetical protein